MKTKQEIKDWLLENCVDECGDIDLSFLDFSDFDGSVLLRHITVKKDLYQDYQTVKGDLHQTHQQVGENLYQGSQRVEHTLYQDNQKVNENLYQTNQEVNGTLYQNYQNVNGTLYQNYQKFGKALYQQDTKDLIENNNDVDDIKYYTNVKEITLKELKAMGYVLKEDE